MFLFFICYIGGIMILFLKSLIIGIAKIIPGVSGAMLAINFNIYEKLINAITNFFDDWKQNFKFLIVFISGILISLVIFSNIILFLLNKYCFLTMMFFIGLILFGTYKFSLGIKYNYKNIMLIIIIMALFLFLSLGRIDNTYTTSFKFSDNIVFFFGGIIEIFASVIPGISATSLLMLIGIYDDVLIMISKVFNYNYVINNFNLYFSYGFGMFFSFIICVFLIKYFINKYRNTSYSVILGLSISSIILLIFNVLKVNVTFFEILLGIILLIIGVFIL